MNVLFTSSSLALCNETTADSEMGPFLIDKQSCAQMPQFKVHYQWTNKEDIKFIVFWVKFQHKFQQLPKKDKWNFFKNMSSFIKTRTYLQCKSYLGKLVRKYGTLKSIIEHFKGVYSNFQVHFDSYMEDLVNWEKKQNENSRIVEKNLPQQNNNLAFISQQQKISRKAMNLPKSLYSINSSMMQMFYPDISSMSANTNSNVNNNLNSNANVNPSSNSRQQQFRECHRLFVLWTQKMKELMQMKEMEKQAVNQQKKRMNQKQ